MARTSTPAFSLLLLCFLWVSCQTYGLHHRHDPEFRPSKLFVFGDSYADTGNTPRSGSGAWEVPYGETFPGKPFGRFSDGRVLTDFVARYFRLRSPIPYKFRKVAAQRTKYGMNFAIGGTGVFPTLVALPNMTTQIDMFQQLIGSGLYTAADLQCSVALVTLSGNDYSAFLAKNGSFQGLPAFITKVVAQLAINIKRIHELGVKRVAVAGLQPLGCLPQTTVTTSFQECNGTANSLVVFHNQLLARAVAGLNNETKDTTFTVIDLYDSFMSVISPKGNNSTFENPLEPCCVGISSGYSCGDTDSSGTKLYRVCPNPKSMFFWDLFHPTQQGWTAVYSHLTSTLKQL